VPPAAAAAATVDDACTANDTTHIMVDELTLNSSHSGRIVGPEQFDFTLFELLRMREDGRRVTAPNAAPTLIWSSPGLQTR
jgi:hypothetical protein